MRRSSTWLLMPAVFSLAFTINPGWFAGCASEVEDEFDFGEPEIEAFLDDANAQEPFAFTAASSRYRLAMRLQQQAGEDSESAAAEPGSSLFAASAHACGQRTFLNSAAACLSSTNVPLTAEVQLTRLGDFDEPAEVTELSMTGQLTVLGKSLDSVFVTVTASDVRIDLLAAAGRSLKLTSFSMLGEGISYSSH